MAKNTGIIQIQGKLGNMVFDKRGSVRVAGGSTAVKFNSADSMQRTRENASEFTKAATTGKVFRLAMRQLVAVAGDSLITSRVTKKMRELIALDDINIRGQRGILDAETEALVGFEINANSSFSQTVFVAPVVSIDRGTGEVLVTFAGIKPLQDVAAPSGTTHIKFIMTASSINFEEETFDSKTTETDFLPYNNTAVLAAASTLSVDLVDNSTNPIVCGIGVEFFQEVNGQQYALNNGAYNAAVIAKVDATI